MKLTSIMLGILFAIAIVVVTFLIATIIYIPKDKARKLHTWKEYFKQPSLMFMSTLNEFYEKYSADQTTPIVDISQTRKEIVKDLTDNWERIRDEAMSKISEMQPIKGDMFFTDIIEDDKWKKMYLKWYKDTDPKMKEKFPFTTSIINKHPEIRLAMFSLLQKGGRI